MADVTITYKGSTIASLSDTGSATLETGGTYCEDDINVAYDKPSGGGGTTYEEKEITFDTTPTSAVTISHTLGRVPKFAIIMLKNNGKIESGADRYRISLLTCVFSGGATDFNTTTGATVNGTPIFMSFVNNNSSMYASYTASNSGSAARIMSADSSAVYVAYSPGSTAGHLGATTYVVIIG